MEDSRLPCQSKSNEVIMPVLKHCRTYVNFTGPARLSTLLATPAHSAVFEKLTSMFSADLTTYIF